MKTKITSFVLLGAALLSSSCEKFLQEKNQSGLSPQSYQTSVVVFENLVTSAYTDLHLWYGKEIGYSLTESGTDILTNAAGCTATYLCFYDNTLNGAAGGSNSTSNSSMADQWKYLYRAVNICNTVIGRVAKSPLNDELKIKREAEARFLRAHYYWLLTETWGPVHFTTKESEGVQTTANKTPVKDIYIQIFEDLQWCLDHSLNGLSSARHDNGRVTLWAAKAFMARLSLSRASLPLTESGITQAEQQGLYQKARDLSVDVLTNGPFTLYTDYKDIWSVANYNGDANMEAVFYVEYGDDLNVLNPEFDDYTIRDGGSHANTMFCPVYENGIGMVRDEANERGFNRFMPTLAYLDMFEQSADQRFAGSLKTEWYANKKVTGKGDKSDLGVEQRTYPNLVTGGLSMKMISTAATPAEIAAANQNYKLYDRGVLYAADGLPKGDRKVTFQVAKFIDPTYPGGMGKRVSSYRDIFVIRVAEMYLIASEASFALGQAGADTYMNTLREKRAIPGQEAAMRISTGELNTDFYLDEYAREFGSEQMRWFQIRRFGVAKFLERVKMNPDAKAVQDYHYIRPIPRNQLDAVSNKDEFQQNPHYQ